jgi:hypothetical protein
MHLIGHVELIGLVIVTISESEQLILLQRTDKRRKRAEFPRFIKTYTTKAYDGRDQQKE